MQEGISQYGVGAQVVKTRALKGKECPDFKASTSACPPAHSNYLTSQKLRSPVSTSMLLMSRQKLDCVAVFCLRYAMLLLTYEEQRRRNVTKETATPSRQKYTFTLREQVHVGVNISPCSFSLESMCAVGLFKVKRTPWQYKLFFIRHKICLYGCRVLKRGVGGDTTRRQCSVSRHFNL